ncbi:MAG: acyl--CoA ligase [Candidatus Nomurabacteria bacterium]|jgi:long-chain acyl-CoA synthetase|nr:acyl--CoA ligase [Candidatus Nomurabacteria bacterium]
MKKINPNQSIYQAWAGENLQNEERKNISAIEYFGSSWTFEETDAMIDVYARAFKKLKMSKGAGVTFCVPIVPATMFAFYALDKLGICANFVSDSVLKSDGPRYIDEPNSETLVILDSFYGKVRAAIAKTKVKNIIIVSLFDDAKDTGDIVRRVKKANPKFKNIPAFLIKSKMAKSYQTITEPSKRISDKNYYSVEQFTALANGDDSEVKAVYNPDATCVILYTGGSTGIPKGIEKTNEQWNNLGNIHVVDPEIRGSFMPGSRNGLFIPPNHPTSFHLWVTPWTFGVTQVLQPVYDKNSFINDINILQLETAMACPSHYATILNIKKMPENALKTLKYPYTGGEPVTYELASAINKKLKKFDAQYPLIVCYGMSETGPVAMFTIGEKNLANKVGKPLSSVKARIVDDNGKVLGDNERGNLELDVRSAGTNMKGYFKNPELTSEFYTKDGYAKTGDIAIRDENGNYEVFGRSTDFFTDREGKKHYLFDIENLVYKHPAVAEAEATKLKLAGGKVEVPVIHIVLKSRHGRNAKKILHEIVELCEKNLPPEEIPKGTRFIEAFGTNPISTKRDYQSLKYIVDGYYTAKNNRTHRVEFSEQSEHPKLTPHDKHNVRIHEK